MNKERRKKLANCADRLESVRNDLENILTEEQDAFDNMPESLQMTTNGMNSEDAIDSMNDWLDTLDDLIDEFTSL